MPSWVHHLVDHSDIRAALVVSYVLGFLSVHPAFLVLVVHAVWVYRHAALQKQVQAINNLSSQLEVMKELSRPTRPPPPPPGGAPAPKSRSPTSPLAEAAIPKGRGARGAVVWGWVRKLFAQSFAHVLGLAVVCHTLGASHWNFVLVITIAQVAAFLDDCWIGVRLDMAREAMVDRVRALPPSRSSIVHESGDWLNTLIEHGFETYRDKICESIRTNMQEQLASAASESRPKVSVSRVTIDQKPVVFTQISAISYPLQSLRLDFDLDITPGLEVMLDVQIKPLPLPIPVLFSELALRGSLSVQISTPPAGMSPRCSVCFRSDPSISFSLRPISGIDILSLPGFSSISDAALLEWIRLHMVAPNRLSFPLWPGVSGPEPPPVPRAMQEVPTPAPSGPRQRRAQSIALEAAATEVLAKCALVLHVRVRQARDLAAKDMMGKSDPYFIIRTVGYTLQSPVMKETLAPVWNEEYVIPIEERNVAAATLALEVVDWNRVGDHETIGHCAISLREISRMSKGRAAFTWYGLTDEGGAPAGKVEMCVEILQLATPSEEEEEEEEGEEEQGHAMSEQRQPCAVIAFLKYAELGSVGALGGDACIRFGHRSVVSVRSSWRKQGRRIVWDQWVGMISSFSPADVLDIDLIFMNRMSLGREEVHSRGHTSLAEWTPRAKDICINLGHVPDAMARLCLCVCRRRLITPEPPGPVPAPAPAQLHFKPLPPPPVPASATLSLGAQRAAVSRWAERDADVVLTAEDVALATPDSRMEKLPERGQEKRAEKRAEKRVEKRVESDEMASDASSISTAPSPGDQHVTDTPHKADKFCAVCARKFGLFDRKRTCQTCNQRACKTCVVKRNSAQNITVRVCRSCIEGRVAQSDSRRPSE